ncbi:MAG: hypothetical protein POG24_11730, partial [Acidocella sp.]|nr:hypothetical protein [Acidocella sp.]
RVARIYVSVAMPILALAGLVGCAPVPAQTSDNASFIQAPSDPQALVGATPAVLNAEFGQPALRRVDGSAQVWLYHSTACGLNLVLYPDASGTPRVAMVEPTADSGTASGCTTALQRAHVDAAHVDAALEHPSTS